MAFVSRAPRRSACRRSAPWSCAPSRFAAIRLQSRSAFIWSEGPREADTTW